MKIGEADFPENLWFSLSTHSSAIRPKALGLWPIKTRLKNAFFQDLESRKNDPGRILAERPGFASSIQPAKRADWYPPSRKKAKKAKNRRASRPKKTEKTT